MFMWLLWEESDFFEIETVHTPSILYSGVMCLLGFFLQSSISNFSDHKISPGEIVTKRGAVNLNFSRSEIGPKEPIHS